MGTFAWELLLWNCQLVTFKCRKLFGKVSLGNLAWKLLLGNYRLDCVVESFSLGTFAPLGLGFCVWRRAIENVCLGVFAWELSLESCCLESPDSERGWALGNCWSDLGGQRVGDGEPRGPRRFTLQRNPERIADLGSRGSGAISIVNIIRRIAGKLWRIILLHLGLVTFRFPYSEGKTENTSFSWFKDFWPCPWPPKPTIFYSEKPGRSK